MKIFVGGSLKDVEKNEEICHQFVVKLGESIVSRGHTLLNGCRGSLDKTIAESANAWLLANGKNPEEYIESYINEGEEDRQIHHVGSIFISNLKDWSIEKATTEIPEQIEQADVTIFVAGSNGTFIASTWARFADKPILGIGTFGGSGRELFKSEKERFSNKYSYLLNGNIKYENLNVVSGNDVANTLSNNVIHICEDLLRSRKVFSIMSFKPEYNDVYEVFKHTCMNYDYETERTDEDLNLSPITTKILDGIKQSDFVIADVSELSPNVFYEIGYAKGLQRAVIITANENLKHGEGLPFDIKDFPVIFYNRLDLKQTLEPQLNKIIQSIRIKK